MYAVQASTQPTASTPVSSSPSNFKKLVVALVVILVSVAVAFGAFWAFTPSSVVAPLDLPSQNQATLSHTVPKSGSVVAPSVKVSSGLLSYWKPIMAAFSLLLILAAVAVVFFVQHSPSVKPVDDVEGNDTNYETTTDYEESINGLTIAGIVLGSIIVVAVITGGVYKCCRSKCSKEVGSKGKEVGKKGPESGKAGPEVITAACSDDTAYTDIDLFFKQFETDTSSPYGSLFRRFAVVSAWSHHARVTLHGTSYPAEYTEFLDAITSEDPSFTHNNQKITFETFGVVDKLPLLTAAVPAAVRQLKEIVQLERKIIPEDLYQLCQQIMQVNGHGPKGIDQVKKLLSRIETKYNIDPDFAEVKVKPAEE